ncbi:prolyl oligopeptidase family serine peptidase [Parablastomonas sp. CN1-191]|uniref:S9 family peptidase n=1 Tax=Parablastomonas sp. CN1-191 TaxID=3400908 RepID=UPI003BF7A700
MKSILLAAAAASAILSAPAFAAAPDTPAMSVEDLLTLKRVAAPIASPDGRWVVWQQTDTDPATYKRETGLWRVAAGGGAAARIADLPGANEHDAAFSPDGKKLWFISGRSGSDQLYTLDLAAGAAPVLVRSFPTDVAGFKLSPDGTKVVVWGDTARDCPTLGCDNDGKGALPGPGTGRLYKDGSGFVRHWDQWETPGTYSRAFVFTVSPDGSLSDGGTPLDGTDAAVLTGDTPTKPFGGGEEIAWSADSRSVYFTARQADRNEPTSTNLDIWHAPLDGSAPHNLTEANKGTDAHPAASPDGRWLAWTAMARPGFEADRLVVQLLDLKSGARRALTRDWDRSVDSLAWTPDSKSLIVTAGDVLDNPAFRVDPATGKVTRLALAPKGLTEGHISNITPLAGGALLYTRDAVASPAAVYLAKGKALRQLSHVNDAQLARLAPLVSQRLSFTGAHGDTVWGMIHKPAGATGKLPVLLLVHGGPQGSFNDGWSWRWNPRTFAADRYAVVTIDPHGSTGYGQAFTDAVSNDWGGAPLEDLQKGLAAAIQRDAQLDGTNACAAGGSYGGYMMNWIEGMWPDRFKCLVQHDGVFDARAMAYETEELWFDEWEHGGKTYYEDPAAFEKWNPVNYVARWKTPMLVITSEKDFRIPYTQGLAAYTALQRKGVPSQLLVFPDENHWVLKPNNSKQWYQTVFAFLAEHLGQ